MFADSLSDSPWANRSRRGWTTLVSFTIQAMVVGGLLLLPLFYPQALPHLQQAVAGLISPPASTPPPAMHVRAAAPVSNVLSDGQLMQPQSIPRTIANVVETVAPPAVDPGTLGVVGGTGTRGALNGVLNSIGDNIAALAPPPPTVTRPPRVSRMMEGNLIYRVQPIYPATARMARIQGTVILRAIISKEGLIENLQVVSGHPMLVSAAVEAVRQWRYRPYLLNNEPIEVETQVTVNFVLGGG